MRIIWKDFQSLQHWQFVQGSDSLFELYGMCQSWVIFLHCSWVIICLIDSFIFRLLISEFLCSIPFVWQYWFLHGAPWTSFVCCLIYLCDINNVSITVGFIRFLVDPVIFPVSCLFSSPFRTRLWYFTLYTWYICFSAIIIAIYRFCAFLSIQLVILHTVLLHLCAPWSRPVRVL
jgi:hypothetical protein